MECRLGAVLGVAIGGGGGFCGTYSTDTFLVSNANCTVKVWGGQTSRTRNMMGYQAAPPPFREVE